MPAERSLMVTTTNLTALFHELVRAAMAAQQVESSETTEFYLVQLLEAFACSLPVISTTLGCEGLDARPGHELLVADTPRAFADACVHVIRDPEAASRLAAAGRALWNEHYRLETVQAQVAAAARAVAG